MNARMLLAATLALLAILAPAPARAQDTVALRHTSRIEPGRALVLADVADLTGPGREALAPIVLAPDPSTEPTDPSGWFRIDLERVRARLDEELGVKGAMVALSGSACDVRVVGPPLPSDATPASAPPAPAPDVTPLVGLLTVRGAVAREVVRILSIAPADLRLTFEPGADAVLDLSTEGRVLEISPVGISDRMPVSIAIYEPSGTVTRRTVRVDIETRRTIALAAHQIERGQAIGPADVATEHRWLPLADPVVSPEEALGSVARQRLRPGQRLVPQDVEPPILIKKGDQVFVRVVTRGIVMTRDARALADGRDGERILFAAAGDPRQRFAAVVVGPGDAMVWAAAPGPSGTRLAIPTVAE